MDSRDGRADLGRFSCLGNCCSGAPQRRDPFILSQHLLSALHMDTNVVLNKGKGDKIFFNGPNLVSLPGFNLLRKTRAVSCLWVSNKNELSGTLFNNSSGLWGKRFCFRSMLFQIDCLQVLHSTFPSLALPSYPEGGSASLNSVARIPNPSSGVGSISKVPEGHLGLRQVQAKH